MEQRYRNLHLPAYCFSPSPPRLLESIDNREGTTPLRMVILSSSNSMQEQV